MTQKNIIHPESSLGENNILMDLVNNVSNYKENLNLNIAEKPTFTYSSELINEVVSNTNKKINDKHLSVGFIGSGYMGLPVIKKIIKSGFIMKV